MYLTGPKGPTEKKNAELIGDLNLVGTRGKYCAVLTERQLTIERFDGRGVRLSLAAIERMRHLKVPILPSGTALLGVISVYLGMTTIVFPWNILALSIGVGLIAANILSRNPMLAVETSSGDRHLVSGNEENLLKLCMMVDRVRHGSTVEEAAFGLEELCQGSSEFPSISTSKGFLNSMSISPSESRDSSLDLFTEEKKGRDLDNSFNFEDSVVDFSQNEVQEEFFDINDKQESSSEVIEEPPASSMNAYERAWGGKKPPSWYVEKDISSASESRIDSAVSDAAEGLNLFAQGGIFDAETPLDGAVEYDSIVSQEWGSPPGIIENSERGPSSSQMIKMAHNRFGSPDSPFQKSALPPPTEEAVREECKAGVVRQAKARKELRLRNEIEVSHQPAKLEDYPALNKLASTMIGGNRVTSQNNGNKNFSTGWLSRLLKPSAGIQKISDLRKGSPSSSERRDLENSRRFQSSQHMRLRSDQDHQAQLGSRIRRLRKANKGTSAKDTLDSIVSRIASDKEEPPRSLERSAEELRFNQLRPTSSKEDPHPLPGIRRLGRL